ncbi:MAG: hypothetical protein Q8R79_08705 [Legionellaceae bacterium]|nr:hypothetical protein [Legionellaceae bacterium]
MSASVQFIPVLNSFAGLTLTQAQWQESAGERGAYRADFWAIRPGFSSSIPFDHYAPIPTDWIINASDFVFTTKGTAQLVSPLDGSKITVTSDQLASLLRESSAKILLWPASLSCEETDPRVRVAHASGMTQACYAKWDGVLALEKWVQDFTIASSLDYVLGPFEPEHLLQLQRLSALRYIESDIPAQRALQGLVYTAKGTIDIRDCGEIHQVIERSCTCSTCTMPHTQAYLHHLYLHTPLLCQRLLLVHNIHWMARSTTCVY